MEYHSGDEFELASPAPTHDTKDCKPAETGTKQDLEVSVIFTDAAGTEAALEMAERLAQRLAAHIRLVFPYEVPYALPLTHPPVSVDFLESQMRNLASRRNLDVAAQLYLCRDKRRALELLLQPHSLVVVGGKRRWWRTAAEQLARTVQQGGHDLIFAEVR